MESHIRPLILYIDDDKEIIELTRIVLEREGYEVIGIIGGIPGIEAIKREKPDLVLLDLMMVDIDGWEVYRQMKTDEELKDIPVIIVTARTQSIDRELGLKVAKVADYITKPFGPNDIINSCRRVLSMSGKEDQETVPILRDEVKRLRREREELLQRISKLEGTKDKTQKAFTPELNSFIPRFTHDLRGGLGVIRNTAGFILDDLKDDTPLAQDIHKIVNSTGFCEVLLRNLMTLGGEEPFKPIEVNLEAVVREVFFMLERKLIDITLNMDVDSNTPTIMADEDQMRQVFMNLIKNAGEAMVDGGTLTVRTQGEEGMLRVEVSDTGRGIPAEDIDRVFDLNFTTKEEGFGVGLHIVKSIVERHGGTIEVNSELGQGTNFIIHLPIE